METHFPLNPQILFIFIISCFSHITMSEGGQIGIDWGRQTSHRLIPSMVVDLLLQNGIRHLKLFSASDNVLKAFAGADVAITVTLPNELLQDVIYPDKAALWLQERVRKYHGQRINITIIHVGTEPFSKFYLNKTYDNANEALRKIQETLRTNGYENVIATTPHYTDVLKPNIKKPSEADFREDLKPKMLEFIRIINGSNAPFIMEMFPILYVAEHKWDMEFSFIDNKSNFTIEDNGRIYRNVFEFVYDSFLFALQKAGAPNLKLTVGTIGWPTDGYPGANISNAERFFKGFLPYIKNNKGTPLRPGASIDIFIHSLVDENLNKIYLGAFQRHWGVYKSNGEPKYKIDFAGKGRDMFPTTAKGVVLMPKRWCVFNEKMSDLKKVKTEMEFACREADCTALSPGGSCSHLNFTQHVSYAFNRYFQAKEQSTEKGVICNFGKLGVVVPDDPSVGTCTFPVEILTAEIEDTDGLSRNGARTRTVYGSAVLVLLPLIVVFSLDGLGI